MAEPVVFEVDPALQSEDATPPEPFTALEALVRRNPGRICRNGQCIENSCGSSGIAQITFDLPAAESGDTVGYRIVWLRGEIPPQAERELEHVWPIGNGQNGRGVAGLSIGYDEAEALDADVALIAVDRAGNESAPSEPVHLAFSGCTLDPSTGECLKTVDCSVFALGARATPSAGVFGLSALAVAWALVLRRRRSARVR